MGYLDKLIKPLFLILPKMSGYINPNHNGLQASRALMVYFAL